MPTVVETRDSNNVVIARNISYGIAALQDSLYSAAQSVVDTPGCKATISLTGKLAGFVSGVGLSTVCDIIKGESPGEAVVTSVAGAALAFAVIPASAPALLAFVGGVILSEIGNWLADKAIDGVASIYAYAMGESQDHFSEGMGTVTNTPIALDLDGDGLEIIALADSNAFFDLDVDGFRENVQWLSGDDGFLALDANANGKIDDNSELFGDTGGHANGWDKLADLDTNGNDAIDANDAAWSDLLVWRDLDGDGFTDEGELFTLDELGITSISLNADSDLSSTYTTVGGDTLEATDLLFEQNQMLTIYNGEVDLDPEVLFMPWLRGYGQVADLPIAMSLDADLKALVAQMAEYDDIDVIRDAVQNLLAVWAGADGISPSAKRGQFSAQKLAILEAFMGVDFSHVNRGQVTTNAYLEAADRLEESWDSLFNHYVNMFTFQVLLEGEVDGNIGDDTLSGGDGDDTLYGHYGNDELVWRFRERQPVRPWR